MDKTSPAEALKDVYRRLLAHYGPQHWWPAEAPFEVIVGAILTQGAAWGNVQTAITRLKAAGALSPQALRRLDVAELAGLIYSSGYYNAKARKLKSLAHWLKERCGDSLDELFKSGTVSLRRRLLAIHGIGPETADSILLYAAQKTVFVIDAYSRRIVNRLGLAPAEDSYAAYQRLFEDNLPADVTLFNEYHALLVRLGKETCRKLPLCKQCCLKSICRLGLVNDP